MARLSDLFPELKIERRDAPQAVPVSAVPILTVPPLNAAPPNAAPRTAAVLTSSAVPLAAPIEDEQATALAHCQSALFANLSGTAGVGKTYLARQLADTPGTVLAATTGIAALNLGEGTTINALLKYFDTESLKQAYLGGYLQMRLRSLRRSGVRRIILDEKSMLNGEQLTYLVRALDQVNDTKKYDQSLDEDGEVEDTPTSAPPPTDEMGLLLVGDFGQLPPVPDKDPLSLKNLPVQFAFESAEWERFAQNTICLRQVRRQDAQDFICALHAVRLGEKARALDFFTPQRFSQLIDDQFEGTTIFAKNDAVERYNQLRLDRLTTPTLSYQTVRTGKQRPDWKLIPDQLTLKDGALVMLLANRRVYDGPEDDRGELVYCNGDLGILEQATGTGWAVRLYRTGETVQVRPVTRQNLIPLEPGRRKELVRDLGVETAQARINGRQEIIGTVSYMPLRCAYGCTVCKTQGLTLDRVQVNLRDPFFRQPGMLFVALSRARTAEGLRIVGDQRGCAERMTVSAKVQPWL